MENLQKRALPFLLGTKSLCFEIFKTFNINASLVKEIFRMRITNRPIREKDKLNLENRKSNQVRFGRKI